MESYVSRVSMVKDKFSRMEIVRSVSVLYCFSGNLWKQVKLAWARSTLATIKIMLRGFRSIQGQPLQTRNSCAFTAAEVFRFASRYTSLAWVSSDVTVYAADQVKGV